MEDGFEFVVVVMLLALVNGAIVNFVDGLEVEVRSQ